MSLLSTLSFMVLYPLVLASDGCILIAIALAATTGGKPWLCGGAFGFFHALYAIAGTLIATELATYSETLGGVIVFIGSLILLKHFVHHRLHHGAQGDCSCEHHQVKQISSAQTISTAAALSIHAFAAGPILRQMSGVTDTNTLIAILLGGSLLIGLLISLVVLVGEARRGTILKALDALPGVVTAALTGISCYALLHVLEHLAEPSSAITLVFIAISGAASCGFGYWIHTRGAPPLMQLTTKIGKH